MNLAIKIILNSNGNMPTTSTKSFDELREMIKLPELDLRRILKRGIKMGTLKEVSPDVFEMTDAGIFITNKMTEGQQRDDYSIWECTKCKTVNNLLNGSKCIKCNYSFDDHLASKALEEEKKELKYPKVTERETLIFLFGEMAGVALSLPHPKNMSMAQSVNFDNFLTKSLALLAVEIKKQFTTLTNEECNEIMVQLNALRTTPIMNEAINKLKEKFGCL